MKEDYLEINCCPKCRSRADSYCEFVSRVFGELRLNKVYECKKCNRKFKQQYELLAAGLVTKEEEGRY